MKKELGSIDRRILDELQAHGRLSIVELAKRVHLTKTPCSERVRRLEKSGIITGYHAKLNNTRIGFDHVTIVHVSLSQTSDNALNDFNLAVSKIPEIQYCVMIAGQFDYMLKVRTRDIAHYRNFLGEQISKLPFLLQTNSFSVMETVKDDNTIPMAAASSDMGAGSSGAK